MVEKINNYKQNATNIYNVLVDSIEVKIKELKENIEKLESNNEKGSDKKLAKLNEQVKAQEELRNRLNQANNYLKDSKLEDLGRISEFISKARDSISTVEELLTEKEHKVLAQDLLMVQNLFNIENKMQQEIKNLELSTKKIIKTNGIAEQALKVRVNGKDENEKMSWGINRFFTDIALLIYDVKRELEEENIIDDPIYSDLILNNLELIQHYHEMVEEKRIEKVEEIKQSKKLFSPTLKSEDETGETELKQANEYYKIKTAVVHLANTIIELGYKDEFPKTVSKLRQIEKYCGDRFNQAIDRFEKSNFCEVKAVVSTELNKDKKESEIIELQRLFKEAYKKIGKEHERLYEIAKKYAVDHEISEDMQAAVEETGKNEAISQMMIGGKIESAEEFKNFLKEADEAEKAKDVKVSQEDFEEEIRRRQEEREAAKKDNNDNINELDEKEIKQNKFEEFMMKKRNAQKVGEFNIQSIDEETISNIEIFPVENQFEESNEEKQEETKVIDSKPFEVFKFELNDFELDENDESRSRRVS